MILSFDDTSLNFNNTSDALKVINISQSPYFDETFFVNFFNNSVSLGFYIEDYNEEFIRKILIDFLDVITWGDIF
jgi:hypothetical protein